MGLWRLPRQPGAFRRGWLWPGGIVEILLLRGWFDQMSGLSIGIRIVLGTALVAVPAFFMGMPFPTALAAVGAGRQTLVPWAWAINGFASVIGAILGPLITALTGFTVVVIIALGCYAVVAALAAFVCRIP